MIEECPDLPETLGAMLLPGTTLFPGSLLPLFIFEPRYRTLLAEALESNRMFAVAATRSQEETDTIFPVGGVGIVRACVANDNGTSNLILQGVARVRFSNWSQSAPYPSASVEPLRSHVSSACECRELQKEILSMAASLASTSDSLPNHFLEILGSAGDCEIFSDLAASCLVGSLPVRLRLVEELDVTKRMEILAAYLTHQLAARNEASEPPEL